MARNLIADQALQRRIVDVDDSDRYVTRPHASGELRTALAGRSFTAAHRRGKTIWLDTSGTGDAAALIGPELGLHLGMSGQMLLGSLPNDNHLRIAALLDDGTTLSFVDQRTFGGWLIADLVTVDGTDVPVPVAHIARDPLDPRFNRDAVVTALRHKHSEIKRQLLNQAVVSGIGNIYADEALWRVKLHGARPTEKLTRAQGRAVLTAAAEVMDEALAQGGTSFDALYVNVNGASGYFDRSLAAYGQADRPCPRCGTPIRRESFMNRSSFSCPRCQPRPRGR